ncbi:hypothetical protein BI198_11400 [Rheinheimera salexigens]|uniref:Fibronectin type-III domain-containing protein n=2 Tax=Rheinheimera salexigens TaxID=1628148 RepID=A0A1E7Q7C7_9GAMM|nr:hypothetical protein BI198_11400 [Rheinheimera salexigens]
MLAITFDTLGTYTKKYGVTRLRIFLSIVFLTLMQTAWAATPADENFDALPVANQGSNSVTINGITYTNNAANNIMIANDGYLASGADHALVYRSLGTNTSTLVSFKTSDGDEFKLNSFAVSTGIGNTTDLTIKGYKDNVEQVSTSYNLSGIYFGTFNVSANAGWENIDEVRISGVDLDIDIDDLDFSPAITNNAPVLTNLNGDSVAWAGVGNYVSLDAGTSLGVSDVELDALNGGSGNYAGASLTLQRVGAAITTDVFGFNTSGALFSVSGSNLQSGGQTFATFTNTTGVLSINVNSSETTATKSLVQDVLQRIQYSNNTPAADAVLRFSISDGTDSTTVDVTVTSDSIYVTNTTDTATININNGVSFSEAVAIALADTSGSQTLILSDAFTSSMVLAGNLTISENLAIDASAAGSSFVIAGNTLTLGSGFTLSLTHANQLQISSTINGGGNLSKSGAGSLLLTGTNSSRTGSTSVLGGTLDIATDTNLDGANTGALILDGGTLAMFVAGGSTGNPIIQTINNPITLGAAGGSFNPTGGGGRNIINMSGVISGSGSLTKIGASVLQLSGNNSYSGQTLITTGGLLLAHNNGLGATSGSTTVNAGSALRVTAGVVSPEPLFLNGTGRNIDSTEYGALGADAYSLGTSTMSGNIELSTGTNISAIGGSNLILSGIVSGTGTLTKTDAGSVTLTSINTYTGSTFASAGTLVLDNGAAMADGTEVSIASGATLRLDASETIGALSGAGTLSMNSAHLTVNQTSDSSFSGNITGSGSNLTKSGSSKLTLSGTSTYTGITSISGGSLNITGALNGTTGATIGSGGVLEGTGSIFATSSTNTLTVQSGGTLSPGGSGSGIVTINGNLTIASGGVLTAQIAGTVLGSGYDSVTVNGAIDVSSASLNVSHSYTPGLGDSYRLLVNDGIDSITGSFTGLSQGGTVAASGNSTLLTAYYAATDGGGYSGGNEFMLVAPVDNVAPTVSSVNVPANATYVTGQNLDFTVNVSEVVYVNTSGGSPQLALVIGSTTRDAVYQAGSGTSSLLFRYTVNAVDSDNNGIVLSSTLSINGGSIKDAAGNNLVTTLNSVGSTSLVLVNDYTVPDAPVIGSATSGDTQASVSFTAPANTGGVAITGYTVTSSPGGLTATGASSPLTVTSLTNGTNYSFTVTATNSIGTSSASAASNTVIPKAAQVITFANPGAQSFGSSPTLTATANSGLTPVFTSSTTGVCTITSGGALSFITAGTCTINADQAGNIAYLPAPQVSQSFSVNAVVSSAPIIGTATAGDAQATVSFTAPASNGGAAITSYTVTSSPGGLTTSGAASPLTVTGLTNGTAYTFSVTANNSAGTSASSATSIAVTPNGAPTISGTPNTSVNQGVLYSFTPTALDSPSDSLHFSITNKPSWANFISTTGALTGTPNNADIGVTTGIVITVSDGSLTASLAAFNLTVTNTNDAPTITGSPLTSIDEGNPYRFEPVASDIDADSTLTFSITNQPSWTTFDTATGVLSGTPTKTDVGVTTGIIITVSDGELSSSLAPFSLTVINVNEAPMAVDDSFTLPFSASNIYNLDVLVNDTDLDQDSLSITAAKNQIGSISIQANKLQFTAPDNFSGTATFSYTITDGELTDMAQVTLLIEGTNPDAPVITVPDDLLVNATGMFTKVNVGVATAIDTKGNRLAVTLTNGLPMFPAGKHQLNWQATDANGVSSTTTQMLQIQPQVAISKPQTVSNNSQVTVSVMLNGQPPSYPVDVTYHVTGTTNAVTEHNLASGSVLINSGLSATISFDVFADLSTLLEKDIVITLDNTLNLGANASSIITVTEANLAPTVRLSASQQGENRLTLGKASGPVTVSAQVEDPNHADTISLQWLADTALTNSSSDSSQFVFDPIGLASGVYKITLTATDNAAEPLTRTDEIYLLVQDVLPTLDDSDSNNNLIPDNIEGFADSNGNGIPNYLDPGFACHVMAEQLINITQFVAEGEPGTCLRKGAAAALSNTGGLLLSRVDLQWIEPDMQATNIGGSFDFILRDLPTAGANYRMVLPQLQPVPENAVYRKFSPEKGWSNFVLNDNNQLFTAAGEPGFCPPPGDAIWQEGLTAGHWCVQLLIEDGGPNDADGMANGTIVDPGGVAVVLNGNSLPVATHDEYSVQWNQTHTLNVLENDTDADGDDLIINQTSAAFGNVSISEDGQTLLYTPALDFVGTDTLSYSLADGKGGSASASVTVVVYYNRAPIVTNSTASTNDKTTIEIDVLANASDPDGDTLVLNNARAQQGSVVITAAQTLRYTPKPGFSGMDTVSFTVNDNVGGNVNGEVTITVAAYEVITVVNKSSGGTTGLGSLLLLSLLVVRRCKLRTVLVSSLLVLSSMVSAQTSGFTVDGFIGQSKARQSASEISAGLPAQTHLRQYDDTATSFALGGSYALAERLALQVHYVDLGETSLSIEADTLTPEQVHNTVAKAGPLLAKGIRSGLSYSFWQTTRWTASAQAGVLSWWSNSSSQYGDKVIHTSDSDTECYWGAAAGYTLTEQLTLQLNYNRYTFSGNKADNLMLGLSFSF